MRLEKKEGYVARSIAGETIIVPVSGGVGDLDCVYTLNEVGTEVWKGIDGRRGPDEIAAGIAEEYDVDPGRAEADVREFVASLLDQGIIEERP